MGVFQFAMLALLPFGALAAPIQANATAVANITAVVGLVSTANATATMLGEDSLATKVSASTASAVNATTTLASAANATSLGPVAKVSSSLASADAMPTAAAGHSASPFWEGPPFPTGVMWPGFGATGSKTNSTARPSFGGPGNDTTATATISAMSASKTVSGNASHTLSGNASQTASGNASESSSGNAVLPINLRVRQAGSAVVHNACKFSVRSNIVHPPRVGVSGNPEEIMGTLAPGATLTHPFSHDPDMGISWKLWREDAGTSNHKPVQLEYTSVPLSGGLWYDMSMIDAGTTEYLDAAAHEGETIAAGANNDGSGALTGMVAVAHPFGGAGEGMTLTTNCGSVVCPAGQQYCTKAYNTDNDDQAIRYCASSSNLQLTLCG